MDTEWAHCKNSNPRAFYDGAQRFVNSIHASKGYPKSIQCPCSSCLNIWSYPPNDVLDHLISNGLHETYTNHTSRGDKSENSVQRDMMENFEKLESYRMYRDANLGDEFMEPVAELTEPNVEDLVKEAELPLYTGCPATKMSATVMLYKFKASNSVTDKGFDDLMEIVGSLLPPRGKAKLKEVGKKRKRIGPIPVQFNERGQPIGEHAANFSSFIGTSARELIPITAGTWDDLSPTFKDEIWKHITANFIVDELYKKTIFQKMVKLWRDYRSLVMKEVETQAKVVGLQRAASLLKPGNVESMDEWLALVKYRTSARFKEKCEKYKKMRERRTLLHKTSKKSFARLEEELKEQSDNPDAVTRPIVWIHAYEGKKKKDSDEVVEDHELVKQVKQHQAEKQPSQPCSLKDDAVAQVLGPDPRGRVRGLGFGAVPSKVENQTKVGNKVAKLETALSAQAEQMLSQSQEIEQLKAIVNTLLARSEKEGNNHASSSGQHSATKVAQQKEKESQGVFQSKQTNPSVQSKQSNHNKSSRLQHSTDHVMQSKDRNGTRANGTKDDHSRLQLLSWFAETEDAVAIAKLESKDPNARVHHVPLGHECWKVWVLDVFDDIALYRPTQEFGTLSAATGSTIAWPIKYIKEV